MMRAVVWLLLFLAAMVAVVAVAQTRTGGVAIVGAVRSFPDTLTLYEQDSVLVRTQVAPICAPGDTVLRYWWHVHGPRTITQTPFRGVFLVRCGPRPPL